MVRIIQVTYCYPKGVKRNSSLEIAGNGIYTFEYDLAEYNLSKLHVIHYFCTTFYQQNKASINSKVVLYLVSCMPTIN